MTFFLFLITVLFFIVDRQTAVCLAVSNQNLAGALTYHLFHNSLWHLAANAISLAIIYKPVKNLFQARNQKATYAFPVLVYATATLAAIIAAKDTPTLGASGIVYAILGMHIALGPKNYSPHLIIWAAIIIQGIIGNVNTELHIAAYIIGAITMAISRFIQQIIQYKYEINQKQNH